jgi:SulP family sulfate permease
MSDRPESPRAAAGEFMPKIVTVLREGYGLAQLRADALAGLTVAIVALPLSMAIAIASGVGPERGLHTAIVGGFLVSLLGGSRFQIGGPAGAFIVLVAACVMDLGLPGLLTATFLSGLLLLVVGALRLGTYIRFIPYPVTVGFTAGIAVIILASQLHDLFGLVLPAPEPSALVPRLGALWQARASLSLPAAGLALVTVAVILGLRRVRPHWPGMLIAIALASGAAAALALPVETIGTRFGALPRLLPAPALPDLSRAALAAALPYAVSFALLGAIESLLSAVVADGMTGRRHRSNAELVAQGVANIGSAAFGGFCVTGTIARTATNVRAGSHGPVSGMLHALILLAVLMVAAPLAGFIPLPALAGVLVVVAWSMVEKEAFWSLLRASRADAMVVLATFLLVVFRDLTAGIVVGTALGGAVFIRQMSEAARLEPATESPFDPAALPPGVVVYRLRGAWFFGAAATLGSVLDRIAERPRLFVVDLSDVPFVDTSGARSFEVLARSTARRGARLVLTGTTPAMRRLLAGQGVRPPAVGFHDDVAAALRAEVAPA